MNPDPGKPSDLVISDGPRYHIPECIDFHLDGSWDTKPHPRDPTAGSSQVVVGRSSVTLGPGSERSGSFVFPWGWNFWISSVVRADMPEWWTNLCSHTSLPRFANLYKVKREESSCLSEITSFSTWIWQPCNNCPWGSCLGSLEIFSRDPWRAPLLSLVFPGCLGLPKKKTEWSSVIFGTFQPFWRIDFFKTTTAMFLTFG